MPYPIEGLEDMWDQLFGAVSPILRLFKSNTTPGDATVYSDFTWADFTGYSAITLTGGSWTTSAADPSLAEYAQQTFTSSTSTPQTIYGWAITRGTSKVWVAARFPTALDISSASNPIRITPRLGRGNA